GKYGHFLGCTNYPKCKHIQPIIKFSGVKCPRCKKGQLVERHARKTGKGFYGCNNFPRCKFATWDKPLVDKCKDCEGMLVEKKDGEIVCNGCKKQIKAGEKKK
ncbi:type I DNA topoisomerase, partial [Patescibacteria group bacterium]